MTASIHPSSIVHPNAQLGDGVEIGPFCDIGPDVVIGDGVKLHARVTIMGSTDIGARCELFPGVTLGGRAQSLGAQDDPGNRLIIGPRCIFRECFSAHVGSLNHSGVTRIGADCFFMAYTHVAHDCTIGDKCVVANGTNIGGHTIVGDQVWFGGGGTIHQFTHIGDHAMVGGGATLVGDLIPYGICSTSPSRLAGINVRGLKRRGFSRDDLASIRSTYLALFRKGEQPFSERLADARERVPQGTPGRFIIDFIDSDQRTRPLCTPDLS